MFNACSTKGGGNDGSAEGGQKDEAAFSNRQVFPEASVGFFPIVQL